MPRDDGRRSDALAERVAAAMFARDRASQALGMRIVRVAPGHAELAMTVRADMLNGHAICHGGFIFTLADSAFAFACNSYNLTHGRARLHDRLPRAGARRRRAHRGRAGARRSGPHRRLRHRGAQPGAATTIALFRGKSYRIKGTCHGEPSER